MAFWRSAHGAYEVCAGMSWRGRHAGGKEGRKGREGKEAYIACFALFGWWLTGWLGRKTGGLVKTNKPYSSSVVSTITVSKHVHSCRHF